MPMTIKLEPHTGIRVTECSIRIAYYKSASILKGEWKGGLRCLIIYIKTVIVRRLYLASQTISDWDHGAMPRHQTPTICSKMWEAPMYPFFQLHAE